ncbi:MAG: restriction endonuclease subunit S [Dehalococcoidia bacterium]|jgi:restriction endonuclease S subunit
MTIRAVRMKCFAVCDDRIEGRLDSEFYLPEFLELEDKLKRLDYLRLGDIANFSNETWNQQSIYDKEFPYIEIGEIDTSTGEIKNIIYYGLEDAPSRAKMVVKENDIIISTTRPDRGAISIIDKAKDNFIASTGFAILREIKSKNVNREYLFYILRTRLCLSQMRQRSGGGNYPAIVTEELKKIVIPIPHNTTQTYVVKTMKSAYEHKKQKDEEARKLLESINGFVLEHLGISLPEINDKSCFVVWSDDIKGRKINPQAYTAKPEAIRSAIEGSTYPIRRLSDIVTQNISGDWGEDPVLVKKTDDHVLCRVLRNTDFVNQYNLNFENVAERLINKDKYQKIRLKQGDILIEKSGGSPTQPVGRVALVENEGEGYAFSNFVQLLRINDECIPQYLFIFLKAVYALNYTEFLQNQTTGIKNLIMSEYLSIPIPIPPLHVQQQMADTIKSKMLKAEQLQKDAQEEVKKAKNEVENLLLGT